ncbi:MAG: hypothetical protein GY845_09125 [Planctomycetes bacterium]|nr:hypothetical protein [Planctomycetota bacterium]
MKKFAVLYSLIFSVILIFFSDCTAAAERDPSAPPLEGAILSPVGAFGDATQYVVEISDNILCGVSQGRLKTFSKDNVEDVISSYWLPFRVPRIFEYYKGYIYLVQGSGGIWIFDLTDPQKIRLAGILDISVASYASIEIKQDKLFLVKTWPVALVIFSLENPEEPQEISRHNLPEGFRSGPKISIVDDRIYILSSDGLVIFDAQDLSAPELLGKIEIESNFASTALVVKGSYAYVYNDREIRIFDISFPGAIEYKTSLEARRCSHAVLRGNHFIGYGRDGVFIYDLSSPSSPELVGDYNNKMLGDFLIGKSQDYIVNEEGKAEPLDGIPYLSDNESRFGFRAYNIVIRGGYAYVFGSNRLWVLDISRPWSPEHIKNMHLSIGSTEKAFINGDYIYTPRQIIDISQLAEPVVIRGLEGGRDVALKDNYLLVTYRTQNLGIWDAQIPSEATLLKRISFDERLNTVSVHKGIIYLGFFEGKLRSCRLEKDLTLTTLDEIELGVTEGGYIMDCCLENDFLYAALSKDGIASVDVEDPYNMQVYARFNTSQFSEHINVFNAYAYISDGSGGIIVVDMLTKGFEKKIASYPTTDWTFNIAFSGNYIYSCEYRNGISIFRSSLLSAK